MAHKHYPELPNQPSQDHTTLQAAHELRAALRHILEALVRLEPIMAQDLDPLNRVLQYGHYELELADTGQIVSQYTTQHPNLERMLLPIARSAHWLVTTADQGRRHLCRNPDCILFFYDTTRSATRSWCSMGCMNRARSRKQYHARDEKP